MDAEPLERAPRRLYHYDEADDYLGEQLSVRLRRASSRVSSHYYPQSNSSSTPAGQEEEGSRGESQELRSSPLPMALKRAVRHYRQVQKMQVTVDEMESWKYKKAKYLKKVKEGAQRFLEVFTLWNRSLQKIGGNFGGGVQSYFLLLRFLVLLNFVSFLLIAGFVIIPSIVFGHAGNSSTAIEGKEKCLEYDPNPTGLVMFYNYFLDILSGTGFLEYSYLFYGYYSNTQVGSHFPYNIPLAYIFTTIFYFAFCFICITARMGAAARVAVATGGGSVGNYSMIVFTGWDYGCLGDQATKLKQKNIHYQLQVDLEEERIKRRAAALTLFQKTLLISTRVLMILISLGLIGSAFSIIFLATDLSQEMSDVGGFLGLIYEYLPSIAMTAGNFLVPFLCDKIALIERYSPSTTVIVAVVRAVFLRLMSLGVLLYTLWSQITCGGSTEAKECEVCHYDHGTFQCWETRIGQEMYKLTLFDLLINIAGLVLVEYPRRMLVDNWSNKMAQWTGRQEFVVSANVLGLVYGQTVVWTGALFCPLLPLINTIKFVILFYCKKTTLFYNCRPALKTFRSTTSTVFFLVVFLFGGGLATVVMVYSLAAIHPSWSCGPFRSLTTMWSIVPKAFSDLSVTTKQFLFFVGSQAFSIPFFVLICVLMCYFIALASVYGKSVNMLRAQLKLEGRDKQFLLKQIEELSRKLPIPSDAAGD